MELYIEVGDSFPAVDFVDAVAGIFALARVAEELDNVGVARHRYNFCGKFGVQHG